MTNKTTPIHVTNVVSGEVISSSNPLPITNSDSKYLINLDSASTSNVTYVGKAVLGSSTASSVWQIMKIDETTTNVALISWADGNDNFDNSWNGRTSISYS